MQRISLPSMGAVAAGGALGAIGRWLADLALPSELVSLLLVNTLGSFAVGLIAARSLSIASRSFIQTGFLGSFTSMSAVIVLIQPDLNTTQALLVIVATFIAAPLAVWLGRNIQIKGAS
jgi:fluoride exporter